MRVRCGTAEFPVRRAADFQIARGVVDSEIVWQMARLAGWKPHDTAKREACGSVLGRPPIFSHTPFQWVPEFIVSAWVRWGYGAVQENELMKTFLHAALVLAFTLLPNLSRAQEAGPSSWHATTLGGALLNMAIFALVGVALAIIGYKLFDLCTPGDLSKEIVENKNIAAAIVAGALIIGVCIIVAVAMMG